MFVAAWRHTTPTAVSKRASPSNVRASRHAIAVPRATPTREATKLCGWVAFHHVRSEAILFPDHLTTRKHPDLDEAERARPRVDDRVLLPVDEPGHGSRSDLVGPTVDEDLALPFDEVENLRVSMAVGRRLHTRLHLREAHEHEVAVVRSHDLLVHDARPDPFLPRLRRQVAHDRSHDPLRRRRTLSCYKYPARVRSATRSRPGTRRDIGAPFPTSRGPAIEPDPTAPTVIVNQIVKYSIGHHLTRWLIEPKHWSTWTRSSRPWPILSGGPSSSDWPAGMRRSVNSPSRTRWASPRSRSTFACSRTRAWCRSSPKAECTAASLTSPP